MLCGRHGGLGAVLKKPKVNLVFSSSWLLGELDALALKSGRTAVKRVNEEGGRKHSVLQDWQEQKRAVGKLRPRLRGWGSVGGQGFPDLLEMEGEG